MTHISEKKYTVVDGKIIPKYPLSPEEKAKRQAEDRAFTQRCRAIFERVKPDLIKEHYDWFIIIEPDSEEYVIDPDENVAKQKASEKHHHKKSLIMRINKTGACGTV